MPRTKKTTTEKKTEPLKEEKKIKIRPKKIEGKKEEEEVEEKREKGVKYFEAVGRRKTSTARVRLLTQGEKEIFVNGKPYKDYFPVFSLQKSVIAPLEKINCLGKFGAHIFVKGGGLTGQAEAARHGIARALVLLNPYFKKRLKKAGFLKRDPRMRERKKFGLKRARRAPQWSKR